MMFLCFISDPKERSLFDSLSSEEKKTYHSQSPKTYLPSMSVLDLREAEERGGKSLHYEYILNRVSKLLTLESGTEANNAFALYLIFHEFGHYNEFELFDRNVYEMRKRDFPYYVTAE